MDCAPGRRAPSRRRHPKPIQEATMDLWATVSRAQRGLRDDLRLHVVAVASLVVAFLCLGTALLSVENLSIVAQRWSRSQHLTVYLRDQAKDSDVAQLRLVLES